MGTAYPARRRDGAATREAILAAGVVEFTEHGYAGAGVRQIAERAGVTAMMINRYFGSEEGLFVRASGHLQAANHQHGEPARGVTPEVAVWTGCRVSGAGLHG
ncbi:TetR/AcrR family transcriptional regulator [Streptomyces sp. NPDC020379]|uniref:TetR/AcrR family transcriptional regulator n=1 Tax=Streptomyces sp. NPDC020379 TaxID=3365071 RepID=UPI003798C53B